MKVLIDTNVALNKLLNQPGFYDGSEAIFKLAEIGHITGYISASAITDIYYIAGKSLGKTTARETIKKMLRVFQPTDVTGNDIYKALELEWGDFEDSVQFVVGEGLSVDYIITRNTKDFISGNIPAVTPEQFIEIITGIG
ncbi:MAG: PIN domain-containing protein [Treponema sp.]|jgi:predicted nucleic acid-binding protein|nr:PIN domain-containing protein [Treponema sp.]